MNPSDDINGQYQPTVTLRVEQAVAYCLDQEWRTKCRFHGVQPSWVATLAQGLSPTSVRRMGEFDLIDVTTIAPLLGDQASNADRPEGLLAQLVDQTMELACSELALPHHSPLAQMKRETVGPRLDDQQLVLLSCRLIEGVAEHDVGELPEDLYRDGINARRLLVTIAFVTASVHAYMTSCTVDPENRSNGAMIKTLTENVLVALSDDKPLPGSRDGYRPHLRALWNHLVREKSALLAESVGFMQRHDLRTRRYEPSLIKHCCARLRVLSDLTMDGLVADWDKIPFMPIDPAS